VAAKASESISAAALSIQLKEALMALGESGENNGENVSGGAGWRRWRWRNNQRKRRRKIAIENRVRWRQWLAYGVASLS